MIFFIGCLCFLVSQAKGYSENVLNETAGSVANDLLEIIGNKNASEEKKELLWAQLSGRAQEKISQGRAYRKTVVETAKANANYLHQILPQYRKHPKLVIQQIYQNAIEEVLDNADEKIIIQPTEGTKGKEIRILLNRDPAIKPKSEKH